MIVTVGKLSVEMSERELAVQQLEIWVETADCDRGSGRPSCIEARDGAACARCQAVELLALFRETEPQLTARVLRERRALARTDQQIEALRETRVRAADRITLCELRLAQLQARGGTQ